MPPETPTPKPERQEKPEASEMEPQKSPEETEAEAREREERERQKRERAEARGREESEARPEEERVAEHALMLEVYKEISESLSGAAREVFDRVKDQITEDEQAQIAKVFTDFVNLSLQNERAFRSKHGLPEHRHNLGAAVNQCLQNSIDEVIEDVQNWEKPEPQNERERAAEEMNERNNRQYAQQVEKGEKAAWHKLAGLIEKDVQSQNEKGKTYVTERQKAIMESRARGNDMNALEERMVRLSVDVYAAENLLADIAELRERGLKGAVEDDKGKLVVEPSQIADAATVRISFTDISKDHVRLLTSIMSKHGVKGEKQGSSLKFEGELKKLRRAINGVEREVGKEKRRS